MMSNFHFFCPIDVQVLDVSAGTAYVRKLLNGREEKLLVFAPRFLCAELTLTPFFTALQSDGHAVQLYTDIPSNPLVDDVARALSDLADFKPTAALAFGGESCIDLAKAICSLYGLLPSPTPDAVRGALADRRYDIAAPTPALIAMPTTAGTGSEATRWATLWDAGGLRKWSLETPRAQAKAAVLIPEWTASMPPKLTLSTGLDALCHAMEAYWAVSRDPLSQALALSAAERIRDALPRALAGEPDARRDMCVGALLAGLAFSRTRTTACHSVSYPLTMLYGIPHGFAAAVTLCAVARRNRAAVPEIARLEGLFGGDLGRWLDDVCAGVQTLKLSAWGLNEASLPAVADHAFTAGRMDNNPVAFSRDDVLAILRECL